MAETGNKTTGHVPGRSRIVVDTSIFVNPEAMELLGDSVNTAIEEFLDICRRFSLEIYMPLSIFRELSTFAKPEAIKTLRTRAVVRAPDLYSMQVPAITFHTFVRELRQRVNKGLHIAEKAIKSDDVPENVRWVRQHYREALRSGIVDSVEDLEVVLLAREVGGIVLTADQGIANMADSFGIEVFTAQEFLDYCNDTIKE
ncbi:MAG: RNA ligase partner protein [Desulfobacterales bacterium]